jgi:hypothetical protein
MLTVEQRMADLREQTIKFSAILEKPSKSPD